MGSPGEKSYGSPSFQRWRQEFLHSLLKPLAAERIRMHGIPDIVPITPDVLRQADAHRWDTWPALLAQTLMRQYDVVEVDHQRSRLITVQWSSGMSALAV